MIRPGKEAQQVPEGLPVQEVSDIAYRLLREKGEPLPTRQLLDLVWQEFAPDQQASPTRLAQVLTAINLDSRLAPVGQGQWGLREWAMKQKGSRASRAEKRTPTVPEASEDDIMEMDEPDENWD